MKRTFSRQRKTNAPILLGMTFKSVDVEEYWKSTSPDSSFDKNLSKVIVLVEDISTGNIFVHGGRLRRACGLIRNNRISKTFSELYPGKELVDNVNVWYHPFFKEGSENARPIANYRIPEIKDALIGFWVDKDAELGRAKRLHKKYGVNPLDWPNCYSQSVLENCIELATSHR